MNLWRKFLYSRQMPVTAVLLLTASGLQSIPSRRDGAPNGPAPRQPLLLGGLPNCQGPTHSQLQSNANSHWSRRILAPAPLSASQPELAVEF